MNRALFALVALLSAAAQADAVSVNVTQRTQLGQGVPNVQVSILEPLVGIELKLKRSDGKEVLLRGGGKPGQTRTFDLPQPEGDFKYDGTLSVTFKDGSSSSMPLSFDTQMYGPLRVELLSGAEDIAARKVRFRANHPVDRVDLKVLMDKGAPAFDGKVEFNDDPAGTPLELTWPVAEGRVLQISVTVHDKATFYSSFDVYPWQADVKHEEVHFESGQSAIPKSEEAKIQASQQAISAEVDRLQSQLSKFGGTASVKLYLTGHTDTVGASAQNRVLSLARAKSIGGHFRRGGLRIPIFYDGFGEEALRTSTPDETPEEKNRRTEYLLSLEEPQLSGTRLKPSWKRL